MYFDIELREWQKSAYCKWAESGRRGIVQVVTGGGKTIFALECANNILSNNRNAKIVVVVPSISLADQWSSVIKELIKDENFKIKILNSKNHKKLEKFNIAVVNTARNINTKLSKSNELMLIVDECHKVGSEKNKKCLNGNFIATLGLSATPERQYDEGLQENIIPKLGPIIYTYNLEDAHRDKVISKFELINVKIPLLEDEEIKYKKYSKKIGYLISKKNKTSDDNQKTLLQDKVEKLLLERSRIISRCSWRIPASCKIIEKHSSDRIIVFHEDINSINKIVDNSNKLGNRVAAYHTKLSSVKRRNNLFLYRKGVYSVIAACRALDEGFDVPDTRVAIISSSTATIRQRIQRMGRVLRRTNDNKVAIVYTIYATVQEEERLFKESNNFSDITSVKWIKIGVNEK